MARWREFSDPLEAAGQALQELDYSRAANLETDYSTLINRTGGASVKGTLVVPGTVAFGYIVAPTSAANVIGVVFDVVADQARGRIARGGVAQVLLENSTGSTIGDVLVTSTTVAGRAISASTGTPPTSTAEHFREIGHSLETVAGGTNVLVWAILHFN